LKAVPGCVSGPKGYAADGFHRMTSVGDGAWGRGKVLNGAFGDKARDVILRAGLEGYWRSSALDQIRAEKLRGPGKGTGLEHGVSTYPEIGKTHVADTTAVRGGPDGQNRAVGNCRASDRGQTVVRRDPKRVLDGWASGRIWAANLGPRLNATAEGLGRRTAGTRGLASFCLPDGGLRGMERPSANRAVRGKDRHRQPRGARADRHCLPRATAT